MSVPTGMPVRTLTAVLGEGVRGRISTTLYYNDDYRIIRSVSTDHRGYTTDIRRGWSATGVELWTARTVRLPASTALLTDSCYYRYDSHSRLTAAYHSSGGKAAVPVWVVTYDGLGRTATTVAAGRVTRTYTHDIRGLLTGVTSPVFSEKIMRTDGATPLYSGKVAGNVYTASDGTTRRYDYTYDTSGRLSSASYTGVAANAFSTTYTYDLNSNPLTIVRRGRTGASAYGIMDNLTLTYTGNRIASLKDGAADYALENAMQVSKGTYSFGDFSHDANGNLTRDMSRGITAIDYNVLGLPQRIDFEAAPSVSIDYAADGTKLGERRASVTLKASGTTAIAPPVLVPDKRYFGAGYVSVGGNATLYTSYGYFTSDGTFHAYIPDSRGNIAAVVNGSTGAVEQQNSYYPYGATTSQSMGADVNPMKFGGKELATLFGRHEYDYTARMYAPLSARFSSPDRKAWDYPWLSPYIFCAADPINYIDPTGEDWVIINYGSNLFIFFHEDVKSKEDINKIFGKNPDMKYFGESAVRQFTNHKLGITREVTFNADGSFSVEGWEGSEDQEYDDYGLHIGNHITTDISKIKGNLFNSYYGPWNPKSTKGDGYSYAVPPSTELDYAAFLHDRDYDQVHAEGFMGVISPRTTWADYKLAFRAYHIAIRRNTLSSEFWAALAAGVGFSYIAVSKTPAFLLNSLYNALFN